LKGGKSEVEIFLNNLKVFSYTTSLGSAESLAEYPFLISKSGFSDEMKEKLTITDNLIRLSMGLEDAKDLIEDISQSLNLANRKTGNFKSKF